MDTHSFVRAACGVWPLRSEIAFISGATGPAESTLASDVEEFILKRRGISVEALDLYRREAWRLARPSSSGVDVRVGPAHALQRFVALAREALCLDGSRVVVEGVGVDPERIARWRASSLLMPADVWVAAFCASSGVLDPPTVWPSILPPQLARWARDQNLADSHVHLGSAMGPVALWTDGMLGPAGLAALASRATKEPTLRRILERALACSLVRVLLAHAVLAPAGAKLEDLQRQSAANLAVQTPLGPRQVQEAIEFACCVLRPTTSVSMLGAADVAFLATAAKQLVLGARAGPLRNGRGDPVRDVLALTPRVGCPSELRLLARAFARATGAAPSSWDEEVSFLFAQYLRVRAQAFAYVTQEPGIPGFAWFQRFFHRTANLRPSRGGIALDVADALAHVSSDVPVRSVELRTVPTRDVSGAIKALADLSANLTDRAELGLILHIATSTSLTQRRGAAASALDPIWHGDWGRAASAEVQATRRFFGAFSEAVFLVRAVDLAGQELALAPWAAIGPLLDLRAAGEAAARLAKEQHPDVRIDGFRATCHAGEVFLTPSQGVRRIAAYLDGKLLRAGDRIGHGIALFEDIAAWKPRRCVLEPRIERLEDLLFELQLARTEALDTGPPARLAHVEGECLRLGRCLFGRTPDDPLLTVQVLLDWRSELYDPTALAAEGWPYLVAPPPSRPLTPRELVRATLADLDVRDRAREPVEVLLTDGELSAMTALQRHVRARVERMEISVESCPTSNLLIGDFERLERHAAVWAGLFDASEGTPLVTRLAVGLHSDNPLTHATRLEDELSYAYHAFLAAGLSRVEAEARVATLAQNGWRARFTLSETRDAQMHTMLRAAFPSRGSSRGMTSGGTP